MSVTASVCSSRTSDNVMLLPLLGTSNTSTAPEETPNRDITQTYTFYDIHYGYPHILLVKSQCLGHLPTQMYLSLTAAIPRAKMALAVIEEMV